MDSLRWIQLLSSMNEIIFLTNHFNIKSTEVSNIQYKIIRTRFSQWTVLFQYNYPFSTGNQSCHYFQSNQPCLMGP